MDWITDRIALGSMQSAADTHRLCKDGITAVLNVAAELDLSVTSPRPIEFAKVGLIEASSEWLDLAIAVQALAMLLDRGHRALVHCYAGVNRSPVVVAVFLALTEGGSVPAAIERIAEIRPKIAPSSRFEKEAMKALTALKEWYRIRV